MDIGKISVFTFMDGMSAPESANFVRKIERLGYRMLWYPEAWGREPFAHAGYLLAKSDSLILATGIANIWVRDPMTMVSAAKTLGEIGEGRFLLGIGVSHRSLVADALVVRGIEVEDIYYDAKGKSRREPHTLTSFAKVKGERLWYPGESELFADLAGE